MGNLTLSLLLGGGSAFVVSGAVGARAGRLIALMAGALVVAAAALGLAGGAEAHLDAGWPVPFGRLSVGLDALSAAFLLPVAVVPALGALYGSAYMTADHPNARRVRLAYGLLPAAMVLVVIARDGLLLLMAWEVMALTAFFLVTADEHEPAVRESGWVYLVATHIGTLFLIAAFAIVANETGAMRLSGLRELAAGTQLTVAVLFLVGFGMKAGLMPLHVWLPGAHANAPSHVSAVMSGVVLKMGVYGIARTAGLLDGLPESAGHVLLAVGAVTALIGAALACAQTDIKRLLAYSSVDNMGIVAIALGLALVGRSTGRGDLVALGCAGAVLHVWNHALFKPLLFFSSGAVIHGTGTREMDRLGGLAGGMPRTAAVTAVGAAALAALPPLNGFASELVIYLGLFRAIGDLTSPALAAPALAATGSLAALAMLKLYGTAFQGEARTSAANGAHDPPRAMLVPMQALAAACMVMPLAGVLLAPVLDRIVFAFVPHDAAPVASLVPFFPLALVSAAMLVVPWALARRARRNDAQKSPAAATWGCGYAAPSPRLQYTGSSLSQSVLNWFAPLIRPRRRTPLIDRVWPGTAAFAQDVTDPVLDRAALPAFRLAGRALPWLRRMQQGNLHLYVLYILIALLALLLWS